MVGHEYNTLCLLLCHIDCHCDEQYRRITHVYHRRSHLVQLILFHYHCRLRKNCLNAELAFPVFVQPRHGLPDAFTHSRNTP